MRLFNRAAETQTRPGTQLAELADTWRGRSRELPDVTDLPWQVMMAALETDGPAAVAESGEIFAALGLSSGELAPRWAESPGGIRLAGTRHGRQTEIRIGLRERNWGTAAAMVTWLRAATPDLRLHGEPAIWSGVEIRGGAEGLVALRKLTPRANSRGYLYDLWLLERLADTMRATTLRAMDVTDVDVPYRMG